MSAGDVATAKTLRPTMPFVSQGSALSAVDIPKAPALPYIGNAAVDMAIALGCYDKLGAMLAVAS